jgi:5-methylcytosine-specific restriction endonuclease McrA
MAKKGKRTGLGVAMMFAFARGAGMPLKSTSTSPYPPCSEALEKLGHPRLEIESPRNHCIRMKDVMLATASGYYKPVGAKRVKPYAPSMSADMKVAGVNVESDAFLQTYEWRRVRMEALKKYGPVCQCCGASPKTGAVMNVDHIKPRKLFPQLALDVSNLQVLCHECNHGKGNWDMTDWREAEQLESAF